VPLLGSEDFDPISDASPLAGVRYSARAHDLVRFLDDPVDEHIAQIVAEATGLPNEPREALRLSLTVEDAYTVLAFARRRAVSALRTRSVRQASEAVRSLTLITLSQIDYRDLSAEFPLHAVSELGGDLDHAIRDAVALSEPSIASYFAARGEAARTGSLRDWPLLEVRSSYGLGYMDHLSSGYGPSIAIAEMAVRLADMIDVDGRYLVKNMQTSDLPEVWFNAKRRTGKLPATGCVSLSATLQGSADRWSHGLLVFLAEMATESVASELTMAATISTGERPQVATAVDRCIVLVIGGSFTHGQKAIETTGTLARYLDMGVAALDG
jgi:hypothetical protein